MSNVRKTAEYAHSPETIDCYQAIYVNSLACQRTSISTSTTDYHRKRAWAWV